MIQRADAPDAIAVEAADRIAEAVRPWRIVLFGSRARGSANAYSDYDLYIEVDAEEHELFGIDRRIRELMDRRGDFDCKVVRRGTLERRRNDPGTIEWDVAREGRLLYADPSAPAFQSVPDRVRERPREAPESVAEWVESAERDERHCEDLWQLRKDYWPEICWLSHQMCEKLLKALLVSRHARPARTHKLTELLQALRESGIDLGPLDADCGRLTVHAIMPRYPAGLKIGEAEARAAYVAAQRIVAAVRLKISGDGG